MGKKILCVFMLLCLLFSLYSIAFSQECLRKIEVDFKNIKILVDEKPIDAKGKTFIYDNELYAPASFITKIVGGEGTWNKDKNEFYISSYKDFPECKYEQKEKFIYGLVTEINYEKREIVIEQHFDDNSVKVTPRLSASDDIVIIFERNDKRMNIDFKDLKVGEDIGLILNKSGNIRGIIVSR